MANLKGETHMTDEGRGIVGPRLRLFGNVLLYLFVGMQFIVILSIMRQMRQTSPLSFGTLILPAVYLCPLVFGNIFKGQIGALQRKDLVSVRVANICKDWITIMLMIVYGILLDFRDLH